jgi:hypothetical protein
MKVTFEKNTQETRINDLNRRLLFKTISKKLYNRALVNLIQGKTVIYFINSNKKDKVVNIKVI